MSSEQYCKELSGIVALPSMCECSLMDFARRLRGYIVTEQTKLSPDNGLINLLCDAARIGYEYGECAQKNLELAQQHLTNNKSETLYICSHCQGDPDYHKKAKICTDPECTNYAR